MANHYPNPISKLIANPKQRDLIAVCDVLGRVHLWKLAWKLSNKGPSEQQELDRVSGSVAEENLD